LLLPGLDTYCFKNRQLIFGTIQEKGVEATGQ
jgi:hypothetical protein